MTSAGEFCEGEIDGKMFLLYNFLSQTESSISSSSPSLGESAINLEAIDLPSQPLFLCPSIRLKVEMFKRKENLKSFIPFTTSPHFPSPRSTNQQVKYLLDSYICKLPVVPLFWCNDKEPNYEQFSCGACQSSNLGTNYYFCVTCHKKFHKECVESPLEINHPSYFFQSLQLFSLPRDIFDCMASCSYCKINLLDISYYCPSYKLTLDPVCAMKSIPFVIDHPKQHLHPLTFFPKQAFLPCNVCGLIKECIPTYACLRCVFVVHQDCIYFPHVIKISRHHHRISSISSLPWEKWFCGVCRREVDKHYGAFTCTKCSDYFVHTRCALRRDLWNGEDLDGIPEEDEIIVEPFETIANGIIFHFSHGHHLKLEIGEVYEEHKCCQACILPIYEGNYYSCIDQCEFFLHETCANAPRKKHHPLHPQPLTLKVSANGIYDGVGHFTCDACGRESCGFVYESLVGKSEFRLDLRCASVCEPFEYQGHKHHLFLSLTREEEKSAICQICQVVIIWRDYRKLNCIDCDFIICFRCATLPFKARYKHDKHFLTFWKVKEASDHSGWCEVCEKNIVYSIKGGFYACDDCCTTIHVDCLLGEDMYMKHGETIMTYGKKQLQILRNSMTRPFCHQRYYDEHRCPQKVVFKLENTTFCSKRCSFICS